MSSTPIKSLLAESTISILKEQQHEALCAVPPMCSNYSAECLSFPRLLLQLTLARLCTALNNAAVEQLVFCYALCFGPVQALTALWQNEQQACFIHTH